MAETLRRLVNLGYFSRLQTKLENWLDDYKINTTSQNVEKCCDVIELNTRVQAQLFRLLNLASAEAGMYTANLIKSRRLPWLGNGLFPSTISYPFEADLDLLAEYAAKDRQICHIQDNYERSMATLDVELADTKAEADDFRIELEATREELDDLKLISEKDKMLVEDENRELRAKLQIAEDELSTMRSRSSLLENYERQIRILRDDVAVLSGRKDLLFRSDLDYPRTLVRVTSPLSVDDVTQRVRMSSLVTHFNDMYSGDRLDAMDILRRYSDDKENNQRIVFAVMQEAFLAAKSSFASFKLKIKANLSVTYTGPETLEEAAQEYINRNADLCDLPALVTDVLRALNRNDQLYLPPEASFAILQPFIREACHFAWRCLALAHPLDFSFASDGELFDDAKYRRSYDSEFSAPLVNHHIWPCLMQGLKIVVKGEACTKRGAYINSRGRSRSRSTSLSRVKRSLSAGRSLSPTRHLSPTRSLSPTRYLSPTRSLSPSRSYPGTRSRSPSPRRSTRLSPTNTL